MSSESPALTPILRSFVLEQTGDSKWRAPSRDGRLVASFAQENMIRRFRADDTRRGTGAGVM